MKNYKELYLELKETIFDIYNANLEESNLIEMRDIMQFLVNYIKVIENEKRFEE